VLTETCAKLLSTVKQEEWSFIMKKTFAGLGVLALVVLGATGATFPANALEVQPVAEIVAASDAIVASPDAVLSQSEPVVTTSPAEVPAEPVAVVAEPVEAPVTFAEPVTVPEPVVVAPEAPVVAPEPVAVLPERWTPALEISLDTWLTPQCGVTEDAAIVRWCNHQNNVPAEPVEAPVDAVVPAPTEETPAEEVPAAE
jgi:hypothetical protein